VRVKNCDVVPPELVAETVRKVVPRTSGVPATDAVPTPGVKATLLGSVPVVNVIVGAGDPDAKNWKLLLWLMTNDVLAGLVNAGGTTRVAELLVAALPLVTTARKTSPFIVGPTPVMVRFAVFAPV
jgi:hypothetical protein